MSNVLRILLLFFSALLAFSTMALSQTIINGKVIDIHTGLPLDSVRIASRFYTAHTLNNGDFSFYIPDTITLQPETTITEFDEYRLRFSNNKKALPSDWNVLNKLTIVNVKGQHLKFHPSSDPNRLVPESRLSPGVYFLYNRNLITEPVLIINRSDREFIYKQHRKSIHISPVVNPSEDTVFLCKNGYKPLVVPVAELKDQQKLQLAPKKWVSSDVHNHSVLTDGSYTVDTMLNHAFSQSNLDVYVNSEHGGVYFRDTSGVNITDNQGNSMRIPRWYSLQNYSWPKLLGQRKKYPEKIILQGFEWNCPGHEHASIGFIKDSEQPDAIADFEYQFDSNDDDRSRPQLLKQNAYQHSNALAALIWMKEHYPKSSYMYINHPSREAIGTYSVSDFRDFNNTAPEVFFGFEGMPGHQKNSTRGSYGYGPTARNRTWGGADYALANMGGLWDALLGEGRHIWTIVNSDFHNNGTDNWPGEYEKFWTAVTDTGPKAWLEGMRSGDMFIAHGELVNRLEFTIDDGVLNAPMGSDLYSQSQDLLVTIRFRSPEKNLHGDRNSVDHIDLISGLITGKIDPSDRSAYTTPTNPSTKVIARFSSSDWINENEWNIIRKKISCTQSSYFRLRGTNLKVNTPGEVDDQGNPRMDEDNTNTEAIAWKDLWFYSNPIFVYLR